MIEIPVVNKDNRIGSVFNGLFKVINETENIGYSDEAIWDFSRVSYLHPFFICGLGLYKKQNPRKITLRGAAIPIDRYLDAIYFHEPLIVNSSIDVENLLKMYIEKSYIPICRFKTHTDTIDSVTSGLQRVIQRQCSIPKELTSPLSYLIGEITDNIHDHSESDHGYIFSQYLKTEGYLNICIADFGISVFGSFFRSRILTDDDMKNEGVVLDMALHHKSTKNRPEAENRGFGLPTTKNMLVNGMSGEFFMLSGGAFHRHDRNREETVTLPKELSWNGTIVLLKIPVSVPKGFNYLKYADRI